MKTIRKIIRVTMMACFLAIPMALIVGGIYQSCGINIRNFGEIMIIPIAGALLSMAFLAITDKTGGGSLGM